MRLSTIIMCNQLVNCPTGQYVISRREDENDQKKTTTLRSAAVFP